MKPLGGAPEVQFFRKNHEAVDAIVQDHEGLRRGSFCGGNGGTVASKAILSSIKAGLRQIRQCCETIKNAPATDLEPVEKPGIEKRIHMDINFSSFAISGD